MFSTCSWNTRLDQPFPYHLPARHSSCQQWPELCPGDLGCTNRNLMILVWSTSSPVQQRPPSSIRLVPPTPSAIPYTIRQATVWHAHFLLLLRVSSCSAFFPWSHVVEINVDKLGISIRLNTFTIDAFRTLYNTWLISFIKLKNRTNFCGLIFRNRRLVKSSLMSKSCLILDIVLYPMQ